MAAKHDININIRDLGSGSTAGRTPVTSTKTNTNDSKALQKMASILKKLFDQQAKQTAASTEKMLRSILREISKSSGGDSSAISDSQISKLAKAVGREIAQGAVNRAVQKTQPSSSAGSTDVAKAVDKQTQVLSTVLSKEFSRLGIKVSAKDLQPRLSGVVQQALPKSTEQALKDLSGSASAMKTLIRDLSQTMRSIQSMRQSGGKVDTSEIGSVITSVKKVAGDVKQLAAAATQAKSALSKLPAEFSDIISDFKKSVTELKKSATSQTRTVRDKASMDPKVFAKEVSGSILQALSKSDALKGTKLAEAAKRMEKASGDLDKFTSEFKNFKKVFKQEATAGNISVEGVDKITKAFGKITSDLSNLPKKVGFDKMPKQLEVVLQGLEKVATKISKVTTEVKLIVNDKQLQDVIGKPVKMDVALEPDTKKIDKVVKSKPSMPVELTPNTKAFLDSVRTAMVTFEKEARAKAGGILTGTKYAEINLDLTAALKTGDLEAIKKQLHEVVKLGFSQSTKGLANDLRKEAAAISNIEVNITPKVDKQTLDKTKKEIQGHIEKTIDQATKESYAKNSKIFQSGSKGFQLRDPSTLKKESLYRDRVIAPRESATASDFSKQTFAELKGEAAKLRMATEESMARLSKSLFSLQKNVVNSLEKQFEAAGKKWAVVKPEGSKSPTQAFKLASDRQWTMQIANVAELQRVLKDFDSSVDKLVKKFKQGIIEKRVKEVTADGTTNFGEVSALLGQWLKTVSSKQIKDIDTLDDSTKENLVRIKESNKGTVVGERMRKSIREEFGDSDRLLEVFKKTYAEASADIALQSQNLLKTVALPAAKPGPSGEVSFQTKHGSERALPKFVKYQTGFEVMYEMLEQAKAVKKATSFSEPIKDVGIRPGTKEQRQQAVDLSKEMFKAVASTKERPQDINNLLKGSYTKAAKFKGVDLERAGIKSVEQFESEVIAAMKQFGKLTSVDQIDDFIKAMEAFNLTAYDASKTLSKVKSLNVYDMMNDVLSKGKSAPLQTLGKQPYYERSVREFEKAIGEIEGMMPLFESNRPRRAYHQENVTNLLTRTGSFYRDDDNLSPDAQKKLIKDLNLNFDDMFSKAERLGKDALNLPKDIRKLSSLGIPESQAGKVEEYRPFGTSQTKFLKELQATGIKLYAEDLTSMAPFQQFQQAGRNISNVTNAMMAPGAGFETPKLRSMREKSLVESGRYGKEGYGLNVTAELRNTASNFEDQIIIAGKLAKAMTESTRTLIKPSPMGRVVGATGEDRIRGTGITEIKEGDVAKVANEIMQIMGKPDKYEGRADKALVEEVKKTISVIRGESVEVQQAKLVETFVNYFGRKFTTRYGSKGVSVTPTGQPDNLADILQKFGDKKVKVDPSATLGYQVAPKSLGKMAAELFGKDVSQDLKDRLIASGNKFMIDIFQNAKIVDPAEAEKTRKLYDEFAAEWNKIFETVPKVGVKGVSSIRETYKAEKGDKAAFELKPIDVRISSYGAAKRGLQTEFMESIFSNLASTGGQTKTTLQKFQKPEYEKLFSGGQLKAYSEALGFKGSGKTEQELAPELFKIFGGKGDYASKLADKDSKALLAKRAAAVEAAASYYSTVIDEFGKERSGFVGEKFLKIIEEPTKYPAWQRGEIERGTKGARLNLPAFSAYSSVFGEQSDFVKELQGSLDINAKKHWEYLKALQAVQGEDSDVYKNIMADLQTVDVSNLRAFYKSTGIPEKDFVKDDQGNDIISPRSFSDTILDLKKFTAAFKLSVPTGRRNQAGEFEREDLYIPGPAARGTYDEPLIAGERGMDQVTRRMTHMVNMAKELDTLIKDPETALQAPEFNLEDAFKGIVGKMVQRANTISKQNLSGSGVQKELLDMMVTLEQALTDAPIDPKLMKGPGKAGVTEKAFFSSQKQKQRDKVTAGTKSSEKAMSYLVSTLGDLLIGKRPDSSEYDPEATTGVSRAKTLGTLPAMAAKLGPVITDELIAKKAESLQRAKIDYYNELAQSATGKSGSINELLFSRKIPAIMGKATTAVVDKRADIAKFGIKLRNIEEKFGFNLGVSATEVEKVSKEHSEALKGYEKIGIPVLKQTEIGVPDIFAKKIPLDFVKKFDVSKKGDVRQQKDEKFSGTLYDLLKYADKLTQASSGQDAEVQKVVSKYIQDDLVPYIESIRFPFTGTSSIAPFKPRLIGAGKFKDREGRNLEENALMVPGIPEGVEGLAPIIEKVQSRIDDAMQKREKLQAIGDPESAGEIEKLTKVIRELSAAISEVIPKYTSQAQKLDYDGDQIEIHSAKTVAARKDIESHFKRFHTTDANGPIRTQEVFMQRFLSEAANVRTTGPNVLGEAAGAFEKKFPAGKGFEFMKSPFLTKELEYMSPEQVLDVLAGHKDFGNPANVIKDVLQELNRPEGETAEIASKMDALKNSGMGTDELVPQITNMLQEYYGEEQKDILKQVEAGIKKILYESKVGDTIEAQLFKVHTGPETEAMYRVHRLAESAVGFGGGMLSGKRNSSEYFKKRFPDMKAMGGNPEEEFHTMVNEVLRFGIQKGMDVKHAGDKPVAGEMLSYLTRGIEGAGELWKRVEDTEDKTFGDLRDFSADNEKAIRMRLGELPTEDVLKEAKKITLARGGSTGGLDQKTREELIKVIVEKVGFKGFLEEMSLLIEKEAVEGLIKQAKEWSPETKAKRIKKGTIEEWARNQIEYQKGEGGINIKSNITAAQAPLYGIRTFSGKPSTEYAEYIKKMGQITPPANLVSGFQKNIDKASERKTGLQQAINKAKSEGRPTVALEKELAQADSQLKMAKKQLESYSNKYAQTLATARNIQTELKKFAGSNQTGAYADMIRGATDSLYAQQQEVEKHVSDMTKSGYDASLGKATNIVDRVIKKENIPNFVANVIDMDKGMRDEVERLSDLAGLQGLSNKELFDIAFETGETFDAHVRKGLTDSQKQGKSSAEIDDIVAKEVDKLKEKAAAIQQLDRVVDVFKSQRSGGAVLQNLIPRGKVVSGDDLYSEQRKQQYQKLREKAKLEWEKRPTSTPTTFQRSGGEAGGEIPTSMMSAPGGQAVPVYLVGADGNAIVNVKVLEGSGFIPKTGTFVDAVKEKQTDLKDVLQKIGPSFGPARSTASYFSPSRIAGGGDVYGKGKKTALTEEKRMQEQLDRMIKSMTEEHTTDPAMEAIVDWGSVLHAKIQQYFKGQKQYEIERYKSMEDEVGGIIGGTADLVEYETPEKQKVSKIIDIKSTTPGIMSKLQDSIKKAGGSRDINDVIEQADDDIKRKLHEYFSQLNTYLKIFDESATAEVRFYDKQKFGTDPEAYEAISIKHDPDRFKKDMQQLATARAMVQASGKEFTKFQNVPVTAVQPDTWPESEDLIKAMKQARDNLYNVPRKTKRREGGGKDTDRFLRKDYAARAKEFAEANRRATSPEFEGYESTILPPKPKLGQGPEDYLANLTMLHDQAKIFQKQKGVDMDAVANMPEEVGNLLKDIEKKGPNPKDFVDLTTRLKDMDRPDFTAMDFIKAWKMYRIAVGDWMIKRAEDAKQQLNELSEAGDLRGAAQAGGELNARVTRLQEFVRRSIGKRTDVYTQDKRYVYPGLAQAAGVYMSPEQIMQKAGEPLGEDPDLIKQFDKIRKGLNSTDMTPPVESARSIFEELSNMDKDMSGLLANSERFSRLGPEVLEAWDFDLLASRATRLREALQNILKQTNEMSAEQKKNMQLQIKYLQNMESLYSHRSFGGGEGYGQTGVIPVPKFETPETQKALHARNIQSVRSYFRKPAEEGGPEVGERFSYQEKILGEAGETIKSITHHFHKYGEALDMSGQKTGQFSETQQDLIEKMQRANATFGNAVRRVVMWGAASRLVYGGVSQLKSSLDEIANIQVSFAQLRMVMNPLETDFNKIGKAASGFAKQYGVPVEDVLKSMKVFAQQGLNQEDVIDRTKTATLASNVTTLNAKEATEALTSAMKIFREEGTQSMRFLDAWSEVEAKHAITADDMANAIKKSAAAAKSAGVNFDQLNGLVAAVGATTRQSGKEVGTSFRFIFRRLFSEEGPKALAKMEIPTLTNAGELRSGFDILGDLAGKWDDLTSAQKFNVAQSIGGTRQYNTLLVLMDQWDEVLRGIKNSTNSKGSAERRNAEIMKTYAKQLERTRAAATEFKMEMGKIVLPAFTVGTKALTFLFESLTAIPTPIKLAAAALGGFFTLGAKGIDIFDALGSTLGQGGAAIGNFMDTFGKQLDIAKYEITGKSSKPIDIFGLKTLTPYATKVANTVKEAGDPLVEQGSKIDDFNSSWSKVLFTIMKVGQAYNNMLGVGATGIGAAGESIGESIEGVGNFIRTDVASIKGLKDVVRTVRSQASGKGLGAEAVSSVLKKEGLKGAFKLAKAGGLLATELTGQATYFAGKAIDSAGEYVGETGAKFVKNFATQNAGFVKSVAPLALTVTALVPALKAGAGYFSKMTKSAQDFEKVMASVRQKNNNNLKTIRDMVSEYDNLNRGLSKAAEARDPEVKRRRQDLGTYESPLTQMQKVQSDAIDYSNKLADTNVNLVVGYDKLGNAVLKTGKSFRQFLKDVENINVKTSIASELDILGKYLDDLAEGSQTEKIKMAMKELAEAFPVVGELVARNIKVSPVKQLEVAAESLNKRLNLKQKYPLSTAMDADIKRLQGVLGKARDAVKETFGDMQKTRGNILSKSSLAGLTDKQIREVIESPELQKAYEMELKLDPKFKLVEGVKVEDIMGKELLSALNPDKYAGKLGATKAFTKANLESAGVIEREGKVFAGDIVTFNKKLADMYGIAGQQAIVKMKDTDEFIVEYFNTRTLEIEQKSLSEVDNIVDGIFPVDRVKDHLENRLEDLNVFVSGAAAGLSGMSAKDFKKDFDLGQRFFGDVSTSTILQGNKGYTPGVGYGEVGAMQDFGKDMQEYFFKPLKQLQEKTAQFDKLRLEGLDAGTEAIDKSMYDEINKLLTVLKNNQVVVQFRAVFVDLMKEMATGQRVLKEEIAIMKRRAELDVQSSGMAMGAPRGLENIDLGVRNARDLTARQRLLSSNPEYRQQATQLRATEMAAQSNLEMIDKFERAIVQIDDIMAEAKGFGTTLSPDKLGEFIEKVNVEEGEGPFYELKKIDQGIEKNTAATVDKLDDMLSNMGDRDAIQRQLSSITDNFHAGVFGRDAKKTTNALERVAKIRSGAESRGDQESVMAANQTLDLLTKQLVNQVGFKKGIELVDKNFTLFNRKFTKEEFQQRALGGIDQKVLVDKLKEAAPATRGTFWRGNGPLGMLPGLHNLVDFRSDFSESSEFKEFNKVQEKQYKQSIFSGKNLARIAAVSTALSTIQKSGNKEMIDQLDDQINILDDRLADSQSKGAPSEEILPLIKKREALAMKREKAQSQANFYGTVQALSATGFAATELAKSFGLTDKGINMIGGSAMGLYASMALASKVAGEELPDSAKEFGKRLTEVGTKVAKGEDIGALIDAYGLKKAGKDMVNDFKDKTKSVFKSSAVDISKEAKKVNIDKIMYEVDDALKKRAADMAAFKEKGPAYEEFVNITNKQRAARAGLLSQGKGLDSVEYKDLMKSQAADMKEFLNSLETKTRKDITKNFPKSATFGATREAYGPELDKVGEILTRGLEKANASSKIKQLLAAYIAVAAADYQSNKTADKTAVANMNALAKDQTIAITKLAEKYPEVFDAVVKEQYKSLEANASKVKEAMTVDKSLVQDTDAAKAGVESEINKQLDSYTEAYKKRLEENRKKANKLNDDEARMQADMNREQASRDSRSAMDAFNLTRKYSLGNLLNSAIQGYSGDVELPIAEQDMSTQQRVYKEASNSFKATIDQYAAGVQSLDRMKNNLQRIQEAIRAEEDNAATTTDEDARRLAIERIKEYKVAMKDQAQVIDETAAKLRKFGELKNVFDQLTGSMNQLKDAMKEVGVQEAVERLPGMKRFTDMQSRLLGGANPEALVEVTAEQERIANAVGMDIDRGTATKYDLQKANLLYQKRDASPDQMVDINRQLSELDTQRKLDVGYYNQRRQDQMAQRGIQPYVEQVTALERVKTSPFASEEVRGQLGGLQTKLSDIVGRSLEVMDISDYRKELEANRDKLTVGQYSFEMSELDRIEKEGYKKTYRQIPAWEKDNLNSISEAIKTSLADTMGQTFEGMQLKASVADPITEKIDITNQLLDTIARKEFGIKAKYLPDIEKKAEGGHIAGPGTATSDSIPALLSDGEFVIKTAAAKKLGTHTLNYMNSYGKIPGFAGGGEVTSVFRDTSGMIGGFADYLKDERMGMVNKTESNAFMSALNMVAQGGLAATEIATRIADAPVSAIAGVEGVADYVSSNSIADMSADIKKIAGGIKGKVAEKGIVGVGKDIVKGLYNSVSDELSTGGTSMTSGILSTLIGAQAAAALKGSSVAKKMMDSARTVSSSVMKSELGAVGVDLADAATSTAIKKQATKIKLASQEEGKRMIEDAASIYKKDAQGLILGEKEASMPAQRMLASKDFDEIAKYLPKGAEYMTSGNEAAIFDTGKGVIARAAPHVEVPKVKGLLQPLKRMRAGKHSVDYFPKVKAGLSREEGMKYIPALEEELKKQGYNLWDRHEGNVGIYKGKPIVIDPGAIKPLGGTSKSEDMEVFADLFGEPATAMSPKKSDFDADSAGDMLDRLLAEEGGFASGGQASKTSWWENIIDALREKYDNKTPAKRNTMGSYGDPDKRKKMLDEALNFNNGGEVDKKKYKYYTNYGDDVISSGRATEKGMSKAFEASAMQDLNRYIARETKGATYTKPKGGILADKQIEKNIMDMYSVEAQDKRAKERASAKIKKLSPEEQSSKDMELINMLFAHKSGKMTDSVMADVENASTKSARWNYKSKKRKTFFDIVLEDLAKFGSGIWDKTSSIFKHDERRFSPSDATMPYKYALGGVVKDDERKRWALESHAAVNARTRAEREEFGDLTSPSFMGISGQFNTKNYRSAVAKDAEFKQGLLGGRAKFYSGYRSTGKSGPANLLATNYGMNVKPIDSKEAYDQLYNPESTYDISNLGNKQLMTLKSAYNQTYKALQVEDLEDKKRELLEKKMVDVKKAMQVVEAAKNPYDEEVQKISRLALQGGKNGKAYKLEEDIVREALGLTPRSKEDAKQAAVRAAFNEEATDLYTGKSDYKLSDSRGVKAMVWELLEKYGLKSKESADQMHTGGVVARTGKIFAEAGEVITPKKLAAGGPVSGGVERAASIALDMRPFNDIISKLESIELKVEDKVMEVENRILSVEDKEIKLDAPDSIPLDVTNVPDMEVKQPDWKIAVDDTSLPSVTVEQPSWQIGVEVPTDSITVNIDASDAASELERAVSSAISNASVKVDTTGVSVGGAVGADALNEVSQAVKSVSDRLITVKSELDGKIRMLGTNNETVDISRMVTNVVENNISTLKQDVNELRNDLARTDSYNRRYSTTMDARFDQLEYRLNSVANFTGTNGIGGK